VNHSSVDNLHKGIIIEIRSLVTAFVFNMDVVIIKDLILRVLPFLGVGHC
jgi:hypothetical protein